ncbi:uncharacterized protein LOC119111002 [Pollicipes pollicipes]|uniref:uncharacterized protein LOC119111002 n=1 Tax=Pollicipes pollicipes TaxID=41117 RepID=UPI001885423C|nr:uncharacterized protein LOC119111002 [Pollicipes pollicipes]
MVRTRPPQDAALVVHESTPDRRPSWGRRTLLTLALLSGVLLFSSVQMLQYPAGPLPDADLGTRKAGDWAGPTAGVSTAQGAANQTGLETGDSSGRETADSVGLEIGTYYGRALHEIYDRTVPSTAWLNTSRCSGYRTWFAKRRTMNHLVYLASHPRSGNTWLRFLIEASTGVFTGSVQYTRRKSTDRDATLVKLNFTADHYNEPQFSWGSELWPYKATPHNSDNDAELFRAGFLGEAQDIFSQNVIVTKTHDIPFPRDINDTAYEGVPSKANLAAYPMDITTRRSILVIRDPFSVMVSSWHYQFSSSIHVENDAHPRDHFRGAAWQDFVEYHAKHWLRFNTRWLEQIDDLLVISYEVLKSEPWTQLQRVHTFLGVSPDPGRMRCVRQHGEGVAHNRRHPVRAELVYSRRQQFVVWTAIHQLQLELSRRRLPPLPLDRFLFQEFRFSGVPAADGAGNVTGATGDVTYATGDVIDVS